MSREVAGYRRLLCGHIPCPMVICVESASVSPAVGDAFVSGWIMLSSSYQVHGCFELFEVLL